MTDSTQLRMPLADDWHIHLRSGDALRRTVNDAARYCRRMVAMPNLPEPVTTVERAEQYRRQILAAATDRAPEPLIPLYLTQDTSAAQIRRAAETDFICGAKLYPAGATTLSQSGVRDLHALAQTLDTMQRHDLPLLIHAETIAPEVDVFDREQAFTDQYLVPWSAQFPELRMVVEHISTAAAADFVAQSRAGIAATVTAHHLLINRSDLLGNGLRPHLFCLPIAKRESDRKAVLAAATSGSDRFFLGTDSAPHARHRKESACGCAGIYTAHAAIELYAEAFAAVDALDKLPDFACRFGARFYRRPETAGPPMHLLLRRRSQQIAASLDFADGSLVPFMAGQTLQWTAQTADGSCL